MLVWKQPQIWTTTHFFDNSFKFGIIRKAGNVTVGFFFFWKQHGVIPHYKRCQNQSGELQTCFTSFCWIFSKFARWLKGSPTLSRSIWFYGRAFLLTEITRHFPTKSPELCSCARHLEFCFDQGGSYLYLFWTRYKQRKNLRAQIRRICVFQPVFPSIRLYWKIQ